MKYRAVVVGATESDGRPIQTFSSHEDIVRDWAKDMATTKNAPVRLYVFEERIIGQVDPPIVVMVQG